MALPETIRVKLSSEMAGAIAVTPVVAREMTTRELVGKILAITGKNPARIGEILQRGSLVSGASRFRWDALEADPAGIEGVLATFPDPDPERPFSQERCLFCVLEAGRDRIDVPREAASYRRLFQRRTFWNLLMDLAGGGALEYVEYSYKWEADRYWLTLTPEQSGHVQSQSHLLRYATLAGRIRSAPLQRAEFFARRA
jgi:hypothetical protein